jgi:sarcosine oxidase subunit gamma
LPDGCLVARLADNEALVLSDLEAKSATVARLESLGSNAGCYPVPRADTYFWFVLTGVQAPDCLLKICGVDIRPHKFSNHAIAQTSIARLGTVAIRDDRGSTPAYHLLADGTSAGYFWTSVLDAMAEFGGRPIGLESLLALN